MIAGRSASQRFFGGIGLYAAVAAYVIFALFPIYWTLKISVTPERLLYSEGITFWPSQMPLMISAQASKASSSERTRVLSQSKRRVVICGIAIAWLVKDSEAYPRAHMRDAVN